MLSPLALSRGFPVSVMTDWSGALVCPTINPLAKAMAHHSPIFWPLFLAPVWSEVRASVRAIRHTAMRPIKLAAGTV